MENKLEEINIKEINALKKKLNDLKFFLSTIADDLQYSHGIDDPIYKKIINAINDDTKWYT